jgi:hypothetical protein
MKTSVEIHSVILPSGAPEGPARTGETACGEFTTSRTGAAPRAQPALSGWADQIGNLTWAAPRAHGR